MLPELPTLMMLLFLSKKNPLWKILLRTKSDDDKIETKITQYVRISRSTITNWKRGGSVGFDKYGRVDDNIFEEIERHVEGNPLDRHEKETDRVVLSADQKLAAKEIVANFRALYGKARRAMHEPETLHIVHDVAATLNMSFQTCQQIIDDIIYSRYPVFPEMLYTSARRSQTDLKRDFERYGGFYNLFVKRHHEGRDIWLRCPLRVGYTIKIGDGTAIRCKINAPILRPVNNIHHWQYDGFLSVQTVALFWMFEMRRSGEGQIDYFTCITSHGRNWPEETGPLTAAGRYLSTGQDKQRSIVTGSVLLQKENLNVAGEDHNARETKITTFMRTAKRIDAKQECVKYDEILAEVVS